MFRGNSLVPLGIIGNYERILSRESKRHITHTCGNMMLYSVTE